MTGGKKSMIDEDNPKELWTLDSEKVPFQKGWFYRDVGIQDFMKKIEEDPRGGKIIGMNFDGKNVEFYTALTEQQMKDEVERQIEEAKK